MFQPSEMTTRRQFMIGSASAALAPAIQTLGNQHSKNENDYVDWSWQHWRQLTGKSRPRITTEQTHKAELIDLLNNGGKPITTVREWQARRESIKREVSSILGTPPPGLKAPLNPEGVEEVTLDGYVRRKLIYHTEPGEAVPAYLLVPKEIRGRLPAVLCPHPSSQEGMKVSAGLAGNSQRWIALDLVKRGYVTFTYDAICWGARHKGTSDDYSDAVPFYRKHPGWSLMCKMVWDLSRGIDYLETLGFVDPSRIGSIGHSHGGYTTLFAAAFDERIKVGVCNCGFDTFRIDGNVFRWSHATALMPRLGFYLSSPHIHTDFYLGVPDSEVVNTPFDLHQVLALVARRAFLLSVSEMTEPSPTPDGARASRWPALSRFTSCSALANGFPLISSTVGTTFRRKVPKWRIIGLTAGCVVRFEGFNSAMSGPTGMPARAVKAMDDGTRSSRENEQGKIRSSVRGNIVGWPRSIADANEFAGCTERTKLNV
jgi:Prolyl oligopeptidase family